MLYPAYAIIRNPGKDDPAEGENPGEDDKMNTENLQQLFNAMHFEDMKVLDFRISYFGDEAVLFIEKSKSTCHKVSFFKCYKVSYETPATTRDVNVRNMNVKQLDYFAHTITVKDSTEPGFVEVNLVLPFLFANITCKEVTIETVNNETENFFWEKNC